jgi:hypothetical protein
VARRRRGTFKPNPTVGLGTLGWKGFTPYVPPKPPTGSYDPALDAQLRASQRGLGDVRMDTATANTRSLNDFGTASQGIARDKARGYADIDWNLQMLDRSYQQLQRRQAEGARAAGVMSGGIALQAAAKRAENQRIDERPLWVQKNRLGEDASLAQEALKLDYGRGLEDRTMGLTRAEREGSMFGLDVDEQKAFQATQYGWEPAQRPPNQGVTKSGVPYIERQEGNYIVRYDPQGNVLSRRLRPGIKQGTVRQGRRGLGGRTVGTVTNGGWGL